jgi:hypothetical protein
MKKRSPVKSLDKKNPELAKQWHSSKNGGLTPNDVTTGSNKKVWWLCNNGHEWDAQISNRTKGRGCPYCSGKKVGSDNNLALMNPELAKQWHPSKNGELTPTVVTPNSGKKVWWTCSKGHEWETQINNRNRGSGCPECSGQKAGKDNNLAVKNPGLAKQWHSSKNGELNPSDVRPNSAKKVWWTCTKGHKWEATIAHRNNGRGCPECIGRKVGQDNNLAVKYPELAKQWHPTKNGYLKPSLFSSGSGERVWWLCTNGHEWPAQISNRNRGSGCPYCSAEKRSGPRKPNLDNNLAVKNPELAKQWHPTKNGDLKPAHFSSGSNKKVWWLCSKGYEWSAQISNRAKGGGCPYCSGRKSSKDNNLAEKNPELAKQWHPIKNEALSPSNVMPNSHKKVWWLCSKGHEWPATIASQTNGSGCPECIGRKVGQDNNLTVKNPKLAKQWHPIKNEALTPKDVTTGSGKKVWWLCSKGHAWNATIASRTNGSGCPVCAVEKKWNLIFDLLVQYKQEHRHVSTTFNETYQGDNLGQWCRKQRQAKINGRLSQDRIDKLNRIGFDW